MTPKNFRFPYYVLFIVLFLISCNSNKFHSKDLSYIKWVENGGYYFLDLKIGKDGSVKGKSGYICCSTFDVDSWVGEVNGTLIKDSVSGTYKYQAEGEDYNKPIVIKLFDDYAVFTEDDEADIVLNLETPERLEAHPRELRKADKNKVNASFEIWKEKQIKEKKLLVTCPANNTQEFQKLIEDYNDVNRWAYKKTIKTLYADFNQDNIEDALIVYEREDCAQGNGYVGDYQVPLIFLSNRRNYFIDNEIIDRIKNELNRNATGYFTENVAYIEIESASKDTISGIYYDWKEGDSSGNPSIKKAFNYYFLKDTIELM